MSYCSGALQTPLLSCVRGAELVGLPTFGLWERELEWWIHLTCLLWLVLRGAADVRRRG